LSSALNFKFDWPIYDQTQRYIIYLYIYIYNTLLSPAGFLRYFNFFTLVIVRNRRENIKCIFSLQYVLFKKKPAIQNRSYWTQFLYSYVYLCSWRRWVVITVMRPYIILNQHFLTNTVVVGNADENNEKNRKLRTLRFTSALYNYAYLTSIVGNKYIYIYIQYPPWYNVYVKVLVLRTKGRHLRHTRTYICHGLATLNILLWAD